MEITRIKEKKSLHTFKDSTVSKIQQYAVKYHKGAEAEEILLPRQNPALVKKAQTYYQFVNLYLKRH